MQVGPFTFKPKLWSTIGLIIGLIIFGTLANWQLNRSNYKHAQLKQYKTRPTAAPLSYQTIKADPARYQYHRARLLGHYLPHSFLLDNRMHKGKVGNMVFTPFQPLGSKQVVLVNRGWVAIDMDRQLTKVLPSIPNTQSVIGLIKLPPKKTYVLKHKAKKITWPLRVQALDLKKMTKALGQPIAGFTLLLDPKQPYGFVRNWQPTTQVGAEKHLGYAVQWLALAAALVIIYAVLSTKRKKQKKRK